MRLSPEQYEKYKTTYLSFIYSYKYRMYYSNENTKNADDVLIKAGITVYGNNYRMRFYQLMQVSEFELDELEVNDENHTTKINRT